MMAEISLRENVEIEPTIVVKYNEQVVELSADQQQHIKNVILHQEQPAELKEPPPSNRSFGGRLLDGVRRSFRRSTQWKDDKSDGGEAVASFDHNHFAMKKTIAMSLLNIALIATNASHLKAIMQVKHDNLFYGFMSTFVIVSLMLQLILGCLLLLVARWSINLGNARRLRKIVIFNDAAVAIILALTVISVMVAAFGLINNPIMPSSGASSAGVTPSAHAPAPTHVPGAAPTTFHPKITVA